MSRTNKWKFDKKILEEGIEKGHKALSDENLSLTDSMGIEQDLEFFYNMLSGNLSNQTLNLHYYEDIDLEDNDEISFEEIKEEVLNRCHNYYFIIGTRAINLIIKLCEEGVFYIPSELPLDILSMDEQVEYTIKNYEQHAKDFLVKAKELILPKRPQFIQTTKKKDITSYVHYSSILEEPFIVVNPNERTSILNHELEHAIELSKKLDNVNNNIYCEVGSIYFEMLFCDLLYEQTNKKYSSDFQERVYETSTTLLRLYPIFKFLKEINKRKYIVSDDTFKRLCEEYLDIDNLEDLAEFFETSFSPDYVNEQIRYVFSHLKAIELREQTIRTKRSSQDLLIESFKRPLTYSNYNEKVKVYQRYLSEIESKR